jgi:hypothetical protein
MNERTNEPILHLPPFGQNANTILDFNSFFSVSTHSLTHTHKITQRNNHFFTVTPDQHTGTPSFTRGQSHRVQRNVKLKQIRIRKLLFLAYSTCILLFLVSCLQYDCYCALYGRLAHCLCARASASAWASMVLYTIDIQKDADVSVGTLCR